MRDVKGFSHHVPHRFIQASDTWPDARSITTHCYFAAVNVLSAAGFNCPP
jgi:hypothetical protein